MEVMKTLNLKNTFFKILFSIEVLRTVALLSLYLIKFEKSSQKSY